MAKIIEINVEDLIAKIESGKDPVVDNYYGYMFRLLRNDESNMFPNPEDYAVVNPISMSYCNVYKLEKGFSNKLIEALCIIPKNPGDYGEYKGGPFFVNKEALYSFLRESQK